MKKLMLLSACLAAGLMLVIGCAKGTPSEPDLPAATATTTCTQTFTPQNTASVTPTSTVTASVTETSTATETVTVTPSVTPTFTVTGTFTVTRTVTPTRTATPTLTPYPTVAAEVPGADYPFSSASEINGWDGIGACSVSGYSAVDYYDPAGAMEISWDGSGNTYGLIRHAFGAVTDLTGNVLSFYIKCPPEMKDYQINISLYSTSAGGGRFVGVINGTGYWQHMTWDLGAAPPCCGTDPAQITELHIMVNSAGQQEDIPGAKIYIDSVDFNY